MNKLLITLAMMLLIYALFLTFKQPSAYIDPMNAIRLAAEVADDMPSVAKGVFELNVQATGEQNNIVYLNSEKNYRDQRNLTVVLPVNVQLQLIKKYGKNAKELFKGKQILVEGEAVKVKIWFYANGKRSEVYYFQTHIKIDDEKQIKILS